MSSENRTIGLRVRFAVPATLIVALAVMLAGCGGGTKSAAAPSAAAFIKHVTLEFSRGQSGRLWDELHPADQAVVSRADFVKCEGNEGFGLRKMKVLDAYSDQTFVAGTAHAATAVTLRVTSDDGVTTATMHAILVDGKWRWTLQPADHTAYSKGKCP